jgi:hypothetical protein
VRCYPGIAHREVLGDGSVAFGLAHLPRPRTCSASRCATSEGHRA